MLSTEQVRPLAPSTEGLSSDGDIAAFHQKAFHRRRCIKICGIISAIILLIIFTIILILVFTVFRVKDPVIKMNNITVTQLEFINGTTVPKPGVNVSLTADVSVKNPNSASFKYSNTTTTLSYRGLMTIGEARGPPGRTRARKTSRMNVTVDIITDRLLASPNLTSYIGSGGLKLNAYSRIGGRVKILVFSRHVLLKMNCSFSFNLTTTQITDQKCKQKVDL